MKVKQRREDFRVKEVTSFPLNDGSYAVYRLEKSGIGTLEALRVIEQAWSIPRRDISYGGRKDRHAVTTQTVTIKDGPRESLEERTFSVRHIGQANRAFSPKDILANEFEITVRGLDEQVATSLCEHARSGVQIPNYFDHQRFGSVGLSGRFAAQAWCLKDYEQAVFLTLAEPTTSDSPAEREEKSILRDHWGDWLGAKARLARSNRRSVVTYLVDHPEGFKKAAALIDRDQRSMLVSAFQSKLWNLTASRWIEQQCRETAKMEIARDELNLPLRELPPQTIPLPSARPTRWDPQVKKILADVCSEFDMKIHQLRFSHPRDVFFSRADRDLLLSAQQITADLEADDLADDSSLSKVRLHFQLKPGQYATLLLRGLETLATRG